MRFYQTDVGEFSNFSFIGTVRSWYRFYVGCGRKNVGDNLLVQTAEIKTTDTQQQSTREKQ